MLSLHKLFAFDSGCYDDSFFVITSQVSNISLNFGVFSAFIQLDALGKAAQKAICNKKACMENFYLS